MNTLIKPIIIPTPPDGFTINPNDFVYYERERDQQGKYVRNKCGRDLLANLIQNYYRRWFLENKIDPLYLAPFFGYHKPAWLVWTGLPFVKLPQYLEELGLILEINQVPIRSTADLWRFFWPERLRYYEAIDIVRDSINNHIPVGLDLGMGFGGRYCHALYVASYDDNNFYVYDSLRVPELEYIKITPLSDHRHVMRLPLSTVRKRFTRHNRVWQVRPTPSPHL